LLDQSKIEMIKRYRDFLPKIVEKCKEVLKEFEIYVFGSILENERGVGDVDVLIVSKNAPKKLREKARTLAKIEEDLPIYHPFEFHIVDEDGFEFYKKHIKRLERVS